MLRRPGAVSHRRCALGSELVARRSVAGTRSGEETRLAGRRTAGGRPISGLRPPRTPTPSRVGPEAGRVARRTDAPTGPSCPRTGPGQRCPDRTTPGGRGGPTAFGVGAVAAPSFCALV